MKMNTARRMRTMTFWAILWALPGGWQAGAADWAGDTDGNWHTPGNWVGGVPNAVGASANLTNDISADRVVTLDAGATIGNLLIEDLGATYYNWQITGASTLTVNDADTLASFTVNRGDANDLSTAVVLNDDLVVTNNNASRLIISGVLSGAKALTQAGTGWLRLTATNTYSGETRDGKYELAHSRALGSGNIHPYVYAGPISFSNLGPDTITITNRYDPGATGGGKKLFFLGKDFLYTGPLTYGSSLDVNAAPGQTVTFSNAFSLAANLLLNNDAAYTGTLLLQFTSASGSGAIYHNRGTLGIGCDTLGTGMITLSGTAYSHGGHRILANKFQFNTFTFDGSNGNHLTIEGGAQFNYSYLWTVNGPGELIVRGAVTGAAAHHNITKKGTGVLVLDGTQNHSNQYIVDTSGGTLVLNGSVLYGDGDVTDVKSGGTLAGTGLHHRPVRIQSGGHFAPGDRGVGTFTVDNGQGFTNQATANLDFEIGTLDRSDKLDVAAGSNLLLDGLLNVTAVEGFGTLGGSGWIPIITYNTCTDSGLVLGTYPAGYSDISITNDTGAKTVKIWVRPPATPTVRSGGVSNLTATTADLVADLVATGSAPTEVSLYWGLTDQGTNHALYAHTNALGTNGIGMISAGVSDLAEDTTYYVLPRAVNANGAHTPAAPFSFRTPPDLTQYGRKMKITFQGYNRAEALTNFPVLVKLSESITGFFYADFLSGTHDDLRFVDAAGTVLNYEVESWNIGGESHVWVQVPVLGGSTAFITAYWNRSGVSAPSYTTDGATWSQDFGGVWHLHETPAHGGTFSDATSNRNDGVFTDANASSSSGGSGVTGKAIHLSGDADYVEVAHAASLQPKSTITVSVWAKNDDPAWNAPNTQSLITKRNAYMLFPAPSASLDVGWYLRDRDNATWYSTNAAPASVNVWRHYTGTYDGSMLRLYIDGIERSVLPVSTEIFTDQGALCLGRDDGNAFYMKGWLDEASVSTVARSSNWIWATYANVADHAAFCSYLVQADTPIIGNLSPSNVTATSAWLNGNLTSTGGSPASVYVYWGQTDGLSQAANWHTNALVGTSQEEGAKTYFSGGTETLETDRTYYYRYYAQNGDGGYWATPSEPFMTGEVGVEWVANADETGLIAGTVAVVRASALTNATITVHYALSGSATEESDYTVTPPSGSVTLSAGVSRVELVIAPLADLQAEPGGETVILTLASGAYVGAGNSATVTIASAAGLAWNGMAMWNVNGGGNWSDPYNWFPWSDYPHRVAEIANLTNAVTTDCVLTLDAPATLGTLRIGDTVAPYNSYTVSGAETLSFDDSDGAASIVVDRGAANEIASPVALIDDLAVTILNGSTLDMSGTISGNRKLTLALGGTLRLSGANTLTNGIQVEDGTLAIASADALGTGDLKLGDEYDVHTFVNESGGALTITNTTRLGNHPGDTGLAGGDIVFSGPFQAGLYSQAWPVSVETGRTVTIADLRSGTITFNSRSGYSGTVLLTGSANATVFGISAGAIGIGASLGASGMFNPEGATIFAVGGNQTQTMDVTLGNFSFNGSNGYNLTFNGGATWNYSKTWTIQGPGVLTINGPCSSTAQEPHGIDKTGNGTVVLNGNQNHVNHFTVSQGKLIINGTVQDDDEIITVAGGATLGGTGSLSRAMSVSNGGILSPGFNGVGTLTFTGGRAITLNATSVLEMELGRPATSDRINASAAGNVTLNGTMNITAAEGFGLSQDGWIPVITYNTATDNGIVLGTTPPKYADMIISNFVSEGAVKVWVRPPPQGTIIRLR